MSHAARLLVLAASAAWLGCSDEDPRPTPLETTASSGPGGSGGGASACEPGSFEVDGECRAAGPPSNLPPPGPAREPAAGIPPQACAAGFDPDGEGGCVAVLPDAPCPDGMMAVPGEALCRPVSPCAPGTWGDIPTDASTQHVDAAYAAGDSDGSAAKPWPTIQQGVDAAAAGAIVAVAGGTYVENVVVTAPVEIWGRCPDLVVIDGGAAEAVFFDGAAGAALRSIAVTGDVGVAALGAALEIDRVRAYATATAALGLQNSTFVVSDSLIEDATSIAVIFVASNGELRSSVVRETSPDASGSFGRGMDVVRSPDGTAASSVTVDRTLVEQVHEIGIGAFGSKVDISASVVRDVAPSTGPSASGYGVGVNFARDLRTAEAPEGTLRTSTIARVVGTCVVAEGGVGMVEHTLVEDCQSIAERDNGWGFASYPGFGSREPGALIVRESTARRWQDHGAVALCSRLDLERVLITDMDPSASGTGWGVYVESKPEWSSVRAEVTVVESRIERASSFGAGTFAATLTIEDSVVRDTVFSDEHGGGVFMGRAPRHVERPALFVRRSALEQLKDIALLLEDGDAVVESTVVRDFVLPKPEASLNTGVLLQTIEDSKDGPPATVKLWGSLVEGAQDSGVVVIAADATIEASTIRDTRPESPALGRGVHLEAAEWGRPRVWLSWSLIEDVHDAGVFSLGGEAEVTGSIIRDVDLDPETSTSGFGVVGATDPETSQVSSLVVRGSVIERASTVLAAAHASGLTIDSTILRDALPAKSGKFGRCVTAQTGATLQLTGSLLDGCYEMGVLVMNADGVVDGCTIRNVVPRMYDGLLGDAVSFVSSTRQSAGAVRRSVLEGASRAGLSVYGATVDVEACSFVCDPIALNSEDIGTWAADLHDAGGNTCLCDGSPGKCVVTHANLEPPEPLP